MNTRAKNLGLRKRRALRIIRKIQPKNYEDMAREIPLYPICVDGGAFRTSYRIVGTNLVIKFPRNGGDCKMHTRDEVKKIRALLKYKAIKKYLPPVYYYNRRDGVMVTDYYPLVSPAKNLGPMFTDLLYEFTGVTIGDLFGDNIRMKRGGGPVIVDCGY